MPHQTMDGEARAAYESQSLQIRAELKKWESDWALASRGKKPGRDDIKQNPDIAQKYKQYNRLRDILAGKIPPFPTAPTEATDGQQQRKRTQSDAAIIPPQTPSKRPKPVQTPRKAQLFQTEAMPSEARTPGAATAVNTPSLNRTLFTPVAAVPTSIGPTPQKDGRVLGIFDLLARTPSRSTALSGSLSAPSIPLATTTRTPSKRRNTEPAPTQTISITTPTTARFASTPQSKTRSSVPLYERPDNGHTTPFKTPTSNRVSKIRLTPKSVSTPSFLRRRTTSITATTTALSRVDEHDEDHDDHGAWKKIGPLRLPRKLVLGGKGLSSVVAGLRKIEDEEFMEEEEAMREMEMEMDDMEDMEGMGRGLVGGTGKQGVAVAVPVERSAGVEVGDSQVGQPRNLPGNQGEEEQPAVLLSGFDNEGRYDHLDQEKQPAQPLRIFKKKGQKRSTRLVNMRPTRSKRPVQAGDEDKEEEDDNDLIPETQFDANAEFDGSGLSDFDDDDDEEEGKKKKKPKPKTTAKTQPAANEKGEGVVKRAVRKVKASAHANFKRLKLKNNGAKGGPGYNSRFRRRR